MFAFFGKKEEKVEKIADEKVAENPTEEITSIEKKSSGSKPDSAGEIEVQSASSPSAEAEEVITAAYNPGKGWNPTLGRENVDYCNVFDHLPDFVVIVNQNGGIKHANKKFQSTIVPVNRAKSSNFVFDYFGAFEQGKIAEAISKTLSQPIERDTIRDPVNIFSTLTMDVAQQGLI